MLAQLIPDAEIIAEGRELARERVHANLQDAREWRIVDRDYANELLANANYWIVSLRNWGVA